MSTLSDNIEFVEKLHQTYEIDCERMKSIIKDVKKYAPSLFGRLLLNGSYTLLKWDNDNFHLFDEYKGVNIFLINLLNDYKKVILKLLHDIDCCQNELNLTLSLFDMEVLYFEPMNIYQRDLFGKDRLNIIRPLLKLESLKNEIIQDNLNLNKIDLELIERENELLKYKNYTLEDIQIDYEKFKNELIDL